MYPGTVLWLQPYACIAGPPQLMMAFTADGQSDPLMVAKRDQQYGTNSSERKAHRAKNLDFSYEPSKAADHWLQGKDAYQLELTKRRFKGGMSLQPGVQLPEMSV